ncbi:MAG TPA: TolC family protein [Spirochaetia bacterium]|nr:TolC family protein [Spirochaetia bacterium]
MGRRTLVFITTACLLTCGSTTAPANPLTEDQAVERGVALSRDLAYQSALLSAQELSFSLGIREYFPRFSIGFDDNTTVTKGAPDTRGKTISLSATQPLLRGGTKPSERSIGRLNLSLERENLEQQYRALEYELRRTFMEVLVVEQKREILLRTITLAHENIDILQTQVRLGEALELDHAQAELELLSLEITLSQAEASLEDCRYQMKKLLSLDPADPLELAGSVDQQYAGVDLSGLEERLYTVAAGYSPELKRQNVAMQKASIQAQAASFPFIPDVDLELTASFTGEVFPLSNPQYSGRLTFSFPIPESPTKYSAGASITPGKDKGGSMSVKTSPFESVSAWVDRKTASLSLDAEARKKEQISQDLRFQVKRMMASYSQAGRAMELARRKLDVQRRKEAILKRQMDIGEAKRIDYLQGAIETANAEIALNESGLRLLESEREWETLLGLRSGGLRRITAKENGAFK